jgi:deoxyribose-phosphate aldolase
MGRGDKMNDLAKYIDNTNLSPQATRKQIKHLVDDSIKYKFAGICVSPCWINYVQNRLKDAGVSDIEVVTVPNWKMGGGLEQFDGGGEDCCETCDGIDYIWNAYKFGDLKVWDKTKIELEEVRKLTKGKLKIIIEAYYLRVSDEKVYKQGMKSIIKNACDLVNKSGADWIKTDSGLFQRPDFDSLVEDCKLLVKYSKIPVKAAGGIKTKFEVQTLIDIGVKRIGTSNGVAIVTSDL